MEITKVECYEASYRGGYSDDGPVYEPNLHPEATAHAIAAAEAVLESYDEATCTKCDARIGFYEGPDHPDTGAPTGAYGSFWLIDNGTAAWAVCEDCASVLDAP